MVSFKEFFTGLKSKEGCKVVFYGDSITAHGPSVGEGNPDYKDLLQSRYGFVYRCFCRRRLGVYL